METHKKVRKHSAEFRTEIARRMLAGENVMALSKLYQLPRSMMYRWREAYQRAGAEGLSRPHGRPKVSIRTEPQEALTINSPETEWQLRQRIAELERKVGQQTVQIDFFKGVFKRLEELPKTSTCGGKASTPKSNE